MSPRPRAPPTSSSLTHQPVFLAADTVQSNPQLLMEAAASQRGQESCISETSIAVPVLHMQPPQLLPDGLTHLNVTFSPEGNLSLINDLNFCRFDAE